MRLNFHDTLVFTCEAMLAGPPEVTGIVARLISLFGAHGAWMDDVASKAVLMFTSRWDDIHPGEMTPMLRNTPAFVTALRSAA